jgi:hypothetical protein
MSSRYHAGDWVEVRSKEEILETLDASGQLEGLPFMAEMVRFTGRRFQIFKRAHKTCDTVFPTRGRRLANAVHLDTRCDGSGHGGCEADCLLFWKEAWIKKVDGPKAEETAGVADDRFATADGVGRVIWFGSRQPTQPPDQIAYLCQATQLPYYTTELKWWDFSQYVEDFTSGNASLWQLAKGGIYASYYGLVQAGVGLGPPLRWLYDRLRPLWRGSRFPRRAGSIPAGTPTPQRPLNLREGELVRVRSHKEILETVNTESKNRGMYWDAEMVPYCDGVFPVRRRVRTIIEEQTGKMLSLKTEAIMLDGVYCQGRYSCHRMLCPRAIYSYWREIWLERVGPEKP